jgi:hypothetical protein
MFGNKPNKCNYSSSGYSIDYDMQNRMASEKLNTIIVDVINANL